MRLTGLSRRGMLAASAGAALAVSRAAPAAGIAADLATPRGRLRAFMLMRGALDDRLVIGYLTARYYGVVGDEAMPLFGVASAVFARYRPAADGGYKGASFEVPFFTDLETGKVLESWKNPYTGEAVRPPRTKFPPAEIVIGPDVTLSTPNARAGAVVDRRVFAPSVTGDDVWIVQQSITSIPAPGSAKPFHYAEIVTLHARGAELAVPTAKRVRCETAYDSISSWRAWMNMGDRPGHLSGIGFGGYGDALDVLSSSWLEVARAEMPELIKDPGAALAPLLKD